MELRNLRTSFQTEIRAQNLFIAQRKPQSQNRSLQITNRLPPKNIKFYPSSHPLAIVMNGSIYTFVQTGNCRERIHVRC